MDGVVSVARSVHVCACNVSACPQRRHRSAALAGGSPLTGGGAARYKDVDGGLVLLFF